MKKVLIYLLMGSSCYAGAGLVTGTLSPVINTNTGGGTGTNTFTNVTKAVQSPAYFGDLNNNVIVSQATLGTAAFPGQMVMTYDSSIGGDFSGQLFFAGADLTWRRDVQMGKITIYNSNGVDPDALIVKAAGGSDNCITIQNQDAAHFSAMRFVGKDTGERGAVGYGNTNAAIYADCDFVESFANAYGFYFASKGFINGGLERTTGNFVWYTGNAGTNDITATKIFTVQTNGNSSLTGTASAGGVTISGSGGSGWLTGPHTGIESNASIMSSRTMPTNIYQLGTNTFSWTNNTQLLAAPAGTFAGMKQGYSILFGVGQAEIMRFNNVNPALATIAYVNPWYTGSSNNVLSSGVSPNAIDGYDDGGAWIGAIDGGFQHIVPAWEAQGLWLMAQDPTNSFNFTTTSADADGNACLNINSPMYTRLTGGEVTVALGCPGNTLALRKNGDVTMYGGNCIEENVNNAFIAYGGYVTRNTNQFTVAASGYTNTTGSNVVINFGATGATFTKNDGTNLVRTYTAVTQEFNMPLKPFGKIVVTVGTISGTVEVQ